MEEKEKNSSDKILLNDNLHESKSKNNKMLYLIITFCVGVTVLIIAIILMITLGKKSEVSNDQKRKDNEEYNPIPENEDLNFTEEQHRQFSREVATQSMILATNNGLPIEKTDQVVLFGSGTNKTVYGDIKEEKIFEKGTSNIITPVMVLQGFENKINKDKNRFIYIRNEIGYEIGKKINDITLNETYIESFSVKREGAKRSVAILTISREPIDSDDISQEEIYSQTFLSNTEKETYYLLKKYFDHIVIVLNVGWVIELGGIEEDKKTSILIAYYPGIEAGNAIADILLGDVNPSGHLSVTWAKTINDYPTTLTFKESKKYVKYKEGLFVGYRYFEDDEEKQSKVVFPFGHGLSYTNFTLENKIIFEKGIFKVTSKVTNIGNRSGKKVVQVYVKKPQNENFIKVQRELVAFGKTRELKKDESQLLNFEFKLNDLASYDDTGITGNRACYVLEKGSYAFFIGNSVADTRDLKNLVYTYNHKELTVTEKLTNRIVPQDPDVYDSNKKPDFKNFTYIDNKTKEFNLLEENKGYKKLNFVNSNEENEIISELPTNKFNEINFKTVLSEKYKMEELVDSMTNEELSFLSYGKPKKILGGKGAIGGFYNSGMTAKYNIPFGDILDGPGGLSQSEIFLASTAWPCSTLLASSFDVDLIEKVGEETGKEARKIDCFFWIAPGMNIHRSPLYGKSYENFSEDPLLTGKMGASISKGIQSKRVSIVLKAFAFDNKRENSNGAYDYNDYLSIDSRIAERVGRELYLKGFEIAIKEGKPWSIMTSQNRVNNMKTSESYDLLTIILREEWKYEGFVMTSFYSSSKHDVEAYAGISVKMPNNLSYGTSSILDGLKKGTLTREHLKRNILYLLNSLAKTGCIDSLFIEPKNKIIITDGPIKVKVMDYYYKKSNGILYEVCSDEDGGYIPTIDLMNPWISFYIINEKEQYRRVRIRYSSVLPGFGIRFIKYNEDLGEITNLESTESYERWRTSNAVTIKLPKGTYELTLKILGYDYGHNSEYLYKGRINWFEFI